MNKRSVNGITLDPFRLNFGAICTVTYLILLATSSVWADPSAPAATVNYRAAGLRLPRSSPYYFLWHWEWLGESWTGNDAKFALVRKEVTSKLSNGQTDTAWISAITTDAAAHPDNALLQFRNAYAKYLLSVRPSVTPEDATSLRESLDSMLAVPDSPDSYEYDRLRILLMDNYPNPTFIPIAARIFSHDPKDLDNDWLYVVCLYEGTTADIENAKALSEELCIRYPTKSHYEALLGSVNRMIWFKTKDLSAAQATVDDYEKFLQLSSPNDGFRAQAIVLINDMKRRANLP